MLKNNQRLHSLDIHMYVLKIYNYIYVDFKKIYIYICFYYIYLYTFSIGTSVVADAESPCTPDVTAAAVTEKPVTIS